MLFNSVEFAHFFLLLYGLYLVLPFKKQNLLLLVGSYYFYAAWDPRFLILILISTLLDFLCGNWIHQAETERKKKAFLWLSISANLFLLGVFKYYNFFALSFAQLLQTYEIVVEPRFLNVVLPVGISFYTFQTMSYTIDIYRGLMKPTKSLFDFSLFVAFFPQLLAGPIETAKHLLPQITSPRTVTREKFFEGCFLIFWGLVEKVVIADNLVALIYQELARGGPYNGLVVLLGSYAGAFVIFCDFDGYSNIARGLGKLMGFDIVINFRFPYLSTSPSQLWRRWHISMSGWFKDYLYLPMLGASPSQSWKMISLLLTFLLIGLWHGASGAMIIWGFFQGLLVLMHQALRPLLKRINPQSAVGEKCWFWFRVVFLFHLWCISGFLFFIPSLAQCVELWEDLFTNFYWDWAVMNDLGYKVLLYATISMVMQYIQFRTDDLLIIKKLHPVVSALFYVLCFYLLVMSGVFVGGQDYVYFQF